MTASAAGQWDPAEDLMPIKVKVPAAHGEAEPTTTSLVFVCRFPGCGRQFQLKGNLKRHQNIHVGDKPFQCDACGRSFLRKADMEVHMRVHTGEKPYACSCVGCDKRFARRSDLLSHERTHSGKRPFKCEFPGCGRRFARRFDLHKHARMHDHEQGERKPHKKRPRAVPSTRPRTSENDDGGEEDDGNDEETTSRDDASSGLEEKAVAPSPPPSQQQRSPSTAWPVMATTTTTTTTRPQAQAAAPISPTDYAEGPGKEFHFELTCTEDHVHTTPDCFSLDEWDALLGMSATLPPGTACCSEHLQTIAEAFATAHATSGGETKARGATPRQPPNPHHQHHHQQQQQQRPHASSLDHTPSYYVPADSAFGVVLPPPPPPPPPPAPPSFQSLSITSPRLPPLLVSTSSSVSAASASSSSPCPVVATANLHDHAAHTACGHLAIQHGDHRDFVVKNHLVCLDSVKSLSGDCAGDGSGGGCPKPSQPLALAAAAAHAHYHAHLRQQPKCAPQDPHRPGCGHLAVRHRDHIDYVVEDNLFCQVAGGLTTTQDADHVEFLDDDFWEFYGAIGSLKTD